MTVADRGGSDWFGHPRGLTILFSAEMWERFSYYGMRALLVLYMVEHLLDPAWAGDVLGLAALRRALESLSGPLAIQPFASQIYGLYTGFVYLTPILGGVLADQWLGRRRTVALGGALMAAGHFLMAFEALFLVALALLMLGNGAFKPNIVTQVGGLYAPDDARRDRAYSIFYVGVNIGAFFSPLVAGTLGERVGWHYGFASAGVGMSIGLLIYLLGLPLLPPDPPRERRRDAAPSRDLAGIMTGLLLLFLPAALFWVAYEQQGNTIALFAADATDRNVDLLFWRGEIPVTWFQAVNPLMIFLFTPALVAFWARLAISRREPSTTMKLALGCLLLALSYALLAAAAWVDADGKTSAMWLVAYFALLTLGELHFWPIALSLVSRLAPDRSSVMGLWLASNFLGALAAGWLGGFWSRFSPGGFFLLVAAVALAGSAMIVAFRSKLRELIGERA
ncbi:MULTISPECIES: peptide MFS transporter [Methylosinus]|uniref:MFS transporter n=1 Tax=Methylosinus trichosporium (strain ATCC 35070 / NCIMB 11131 / UNIQEM 75 / OB3b) TaxID=595536 RepID=A0A2D2D4U1_METT3|nr:MULTISPECIES: peptide MFS transporter [Methylosinus]ATQ70037.1 MFS transporter [Methylosinus trichosporium OB3b]OBS50419.1 peptide ABC transporter [Methylosinus sp. 3S-1]